MRIAPEISMTILKYTSAAAVIVTLAAACASAPKQNADLDAARIEVQQAMSDPLAQEASAMRLKKAEDALRLADESFKQRKPEALVRHQAFLAGRQAQIAKEQITELRARQEIEQGQAERNRVLLEARTSEAALAQSDAARAQSDAERAKRDAAAQAADAQAARDQLAASSDESARLRTELEALQAKQTDRGMVLTLGDVLFDTNQASVRPGAMLTLERLAAVMRDKGTLAVMIEGHTDSVGDDGYNQSLSQRRADAVTGVLTSKGVAVERVNSRGLGEGYPVASNDNSAGRQQNRRVEIIFSDAKGQFLPAAQRLTVR
jgi:outer membrane protein OmpA-like peptidoglycan-associated protein